MMQMSAITPKKHRFPDQSTVIGTTNNEGQKNGAHEDESAGTTPAASRPSNTDTNSNAGRNSKAQKRHKTQEHSSAPEAASVRTSASLGKTSKARALGKTRTASQSGTTSPGNAPVSAIGTADTNRAADADGALTQGCANGTQVNSCLAQAYPQAKCSLTHSNAFELLIATILSAQTTDARVNQVTVPLFAAFPTAFELAEASPDQVQEILQSLGCFRRKTESIIATAQALVADYQGQVPGDRQQLIALSGVGRKTANVVLGNWFGIPAITVDTHVGRLAQRLGWTCHDDPLKAEADIAVVLPTAEWTDACHRLIAHGRAICQSRRPKCDQCVLATICPSATSL